MDVAPIFTQFLGVNLFTPAILLDKRVSFFAAAKPRRPFTQGPIVNFARAVRGAPQYPLST